MKALYSVISSMDYILNKKKILLCHSLNNKKSYIKTLEKYFKKKHVYEKNTNYIIILYVYKFFCR